MMRMMRWKGIYIAGTCCLVVGLLVGGLGLATGALDSEKYAEKMGLIDTEETISETITSVFVSAQQATVILQSGETTQVKAERIDADGYRVSVEDGILQIVQNAADSDAWYHQVQFTPITNSAKITVTLPEETYQAIAVDVDCGDCTVTDVCAGTVSVDLAYGACTIENIDVTSCTVDCDAGDCSISTCTIYGTLSVHQDYGACTLWNTTIGNRCKLENACGDITAEQVTCGSSAMELDYGELSLQNYTETDEEEASSFVLAAGDLTLCQVQLYQAEMALDFGTFEAEDAALYGRTSITVEAGDLRLQLRGSRTMYDVVQAVSANNANTNHETNCVLLDAAEQNISVEFTE